MIEDLMTDVSILDFESFVDTEFTFISAIEKEIEVDPEVAGKINQ